MPMLARKLVSILTAGALLLSTSAPSFAATSAPLSADPAACRVDDEEAFRAEVERLTLTALEVGLKDVDYGGLVNEVWNNQDVDLVLDRRIDEAIEQIREETSWTTILKSLASQEAARKLAEAVAERTYRSEEMKKAIENLAGGVGEGLAGRIELATLDAAVPAVACVRAFLGPRYGTTISLMVADDTGRQFESTAAAGSADISTGDLAVQSKGLIAGTVILIVRRTLANLAKRLGQRVVGAVLSRLVSVVAGGVGVVLIAKDIWDMRNGVLPIIEEEMKSPESKERVRAELAMAISEQLGAHLGEVSKSTSERILDVWHEFKQAHAKVVDLSERHGDFKGFIDSVDRGQLPRVDRVVALVLEKEGEPGVLKRLENGTLDGAIKQLPDAALDIASDAKSLDAAFGWQRLAGSDLDKVLAYGMHRVSQPEDYTLESFRQLVALEDPVAIARVSHLPRLGREAVSALAPDRLRALARALSPEELAAFAGYLQGLGTNASVRFMSAIADEPQRMKAFAPGYVQQAILGSRDQEAAIGMLLRGGALFDLANMQSDLQLILDGSVSPLLIWEKHPSAIMGVGILALFLFMAMLRMMIGGRRRR